MMCRTMNWLSLMAALVVLPGAALAGGPAASPRGGDGFTSTTTHIEADAWSFLKIDRPESQKPSKQTIASAATDKMREESYYLLLVASHRYYDGRERLRATHLGLMELPSYFTFDKHGYNSHYLVSLYDSVELRRYAHDEDPTGSSSFRRNVFLHLPIVLTGYWSLDEAPDSHYWEVLDIPLATILAHETRKDGETWKFLNVPLVRGFQYRRHGAVADTVVLDVPLAKFYESHRTKGYRHWTLLDLPLIKVFSGRWNPDYQCWDLLDLPLVKLAASEQSKNYGKAEILDLPLVYLWRSEAKKDWANARFLKLPLVGPLFAWWRNGTGRHAGILPGLFSGSYRE